MKRSNVQILFICTILSAITLLYFFFDARHSAVFPKCPFFLLTGLFCPGCGSQRAISSLLHGDILQASAFNLLLVVTLPLLLYSTGVSVINSFRKKQVVQRIFYSPFITKIILAGVLIFWVFRNIPLYPFNALAPHVLQK